MPTMQKETIKFVSIMTVEFFIKHHMQRVEKKHDMTRENISYNHSYSNLTFTEALTMSGR